MAVHRHRLHKHTLRTTERADRAKSAFSNAVVNGSARNAEKLGSLVDRHAPAQLRLERQCGGSEDRGFHLRFNLH